MVIIAHEIDRRPEHQRVGTHRNWSADKPSVTSKAIEPSTETGCNAKLLLDPPTRTLAPTPGPRAISPLAPTYVPASAPAGTPWVGANTARPDRLCRLTRVHILAGCEASILPVCLPEIKSGHIRDAIRRGLVGKEYPCPLCGAR